jgi:ribosomal protein S14
MPAKVLRDIKLREKFCLLQKRRLLLKAIASNEFLPRYKRSMAQKLLNRFRYVAKTHIKNYCKKTAHGRSVIGKFKMTRGQFRVYADKGMIPGVRRSGW